MKFVFVALTIAREGRLTKARVLDWCCQFGENAPVLPPNMNILPMAAENAKHPTRREKRILGKYTGFHPTAISFCKAHVESLPLFSFFYLK